MKTAKNKIFTLPNGITLLRLVMIPAIVWAFLVRKNSTLAFLLVLLSGLSDLADGYIARRFHAVSDLGKALDPVADKLTQFSTLLCLTLQFPHMLFPACLLAAKEIFTGILALCSIRKQRKIEGAVWHGKLTTALLYCTVGLHLILPEISPWFSDALIGLSVIAMLYSAVCYGNMHLKALKKEEVSL